MYFISTAIYSFDHRYENIIRREYYIINLFYIHLEVYAKIFLTFVFCWVIQCVGILY